MLVSQFIQQVAEANNRLTKIRTKWLELQQKISKAKWNLLILCNTGSSRIGIIWRRFGRIYFSHWGHSLGTIRFSWRRRPWTLAIIEWIWQIFSLKNLALKKYSSNNKEFWVYMLEGEQRVWSLTAEKVSVIVHPYLKDIELIMEFKK